MEHGPASTSCRLRMSKRIFLWHRSSSGTKTIEMEQKKSKVIVDMWMGITPSVAPVLAFRVQKFHTGNRTPDSLLDHQRGRWSHGSKILSLLDCIRGRKCIYLLFMYYKVLIRFMTKG
jgi:hypothetical protein